MDIRIDANVAVVFDLDDTLYNEIDFLRSAYMAIAQHLEPKDYSLLFVEMFSRYRSGENVFDFLTKKYDSTLNDLVNTYRNHQPTLKLKPTTRKLLTGIKEKGGKLAIITDGRSLTQRAKLKALQIENLFDLIVISEEFGTEKPEINNFRHVEKKLQVSSYYYIGDNLKKDFISPKKLGWETIALIDNGLNIHSKSYQHTDFHKLPNHFIFKLKNIHLI